MSTIRKGTILLAKDFDYLGLGIKIRSCFHRSSTTDHEFLKQGRISDNSDA
jgi:hypothetical protein